MPFHLPVSADVTAGKFSREACALSRVEERTEIGTASSLAGEWNFSIE
jgi:hypothetical protein